MRVVILGTGTGVGKSVVARLLTAALREQGVRVLALKPIETGIARDRDGRPPARSDAGALEKASGFRPDPHPLYALRDPVSAHLAARRERTRIDPPRVGRWVSRLEREASAPPITDARSGVAPHVMSLTLIETAGAALSPLGLRTTNVDLARTLGAEVWVLVAPDALGVLHDVRATVGALEALGRPPDFLVLSAARVPDASTGTNAAELARVGLPRPVAVVPRGARSPGALSRLARELLRRARA